MGYAFYILLFLMSLPAKADEIPAATREHLARLKAMAVSLARDPSKAVALSKITAEIERISAEYKIDLEGKPKPQGFRMDPFKPGSPRPSGGGAGTMHSLDREFQEFARASVANGGLGLSLQEAKDWALYNIGRGMEREALAAFKERYRLALAFGLKPFSAGGFGFQFESEAARWAEKMADKVVGIRRFIATYEPALHFAARPIAHGGMGLTLNNGEARGWAESAAERFSRPDLMYFIDRYELAVVHAQNPLAQGGLGLDGRAASNWAKDQATRFSLNEIKAKIRPAPASADPYRRASSVRESCGRIFNKLF